MSRMLLAFDLDGTFLNDEKQIPEENIRALDRMLNRLHDAVARGGVAARAEYFELCADANHEACGRDGLYRTVIGAVERVDPVEKLLVVGGKRIAFSDIRKLEIRNG